MSGCIKHIDGIRISKQGFEVHECPEMLSDRAVWNARESQQKQGRKISFHHRRAAYYTEEEKNGPIET